MMDPKLEMMAQRAAKFVPPSQRDRMPMTNDRAAMMKDKMGDMMKKPQTVGVEAGVEKTAVAAPGKPVVEKAKEYIKPFASKGAPIAADALKRKLGAM